MHPDIIKFWQDHANDIVHEDMLSYEVWFYYLPKPSKAKYFLAVKKKDEIVYFINEQWLTEQEALRLIKLKAFL